MSIIKTGKGKLGFGLMRLPKSGDEIDIEQTKQMVDRFMEEGYTYFDTAWAYEGSEEAMRKALVERYPRESYTVATKLAAWINTNSREEAMQQFETSLERSGLDYIDYYLLHNLGAHRTVPFDEYDLWSYVKDLKAQGRIKHIGISSHATAEELEAILDAHPEIEFVQIQLNYMDWENPAIQAKACYDVITAHNLPVIVMEPVKGGTLAKLPERAEAVLKAAEPEMSISSWAIRFAAEKENVAVVLSGMSNMEQMEDNLATMNGFTKFSDEQTATLNAAIEEVKKVPRIPCTVCNYCSKVCPMDIGVSGTFTAMNYFMEYEDLKYAQGQHNWFVKAHGHKTADQCIQCGACEDACPQNIAIRDELKRGVEMLELQ